MEVQQRLWRKSTQYLFEQDITSCAGDKHLLLKRNEDFISALAAVCVHCFKHMS
jgi:hypothetical protein